MAAVESPCTKICTIDAASGLCVGCGRSLDEIARWLSLSEAERRRIIDELPARLRRADRSAVAAGP
jgi:predicted Fe-S protein YdhL (DUF1289 family)